MKAISFEMMTKRFETLREQPRSKITNQRQELIKKFLDRLNEDRDGSKYKKISPAFVGVKMSFMSESELHRFYGYCNDAKNTRSHRVELGYADIHRLLFS